MTFSRREFLHTGIAASSVLILPRGLRGQSSIAPSSRLQIAMIGVGARGRAPLAALQDEQIVAFCDVDYDRARGGASQEKKGKELLERFKQARWFHDYRLMFEQMSEQIDAVVIT